jgi:hypothetical protein
MVIQRNSHEPLESPAEIDPFQSSATVSFAASERGLPSEVEFVYASSFGNSDSFCIRQVFKILSIVATPKIVSGRNPTMMKISIRVGPALFWYAL